MCGVTGIIVKSNPIYASRVYYDLLKASEIRGQDGTGITRLRNGEFFTEKWNTKVSKISPSAIFKIISLKVGDRVIAQNRYAIFGLGHENDQPLLTNKIALVHNGVLYDYEKQFKDIQEREDIRLDRKLKVDTELLLRLSDFYYPDMNIVLRAFQGEATCLILSNTTYPFIAFMKNKILYSGEDKYGNIYFFSTMYIKNKVPQICKNIYEFKNNDIKYY